MGLEFSKQIYQDNMKVLDLQKTIVANIEFRLILFVIFTTEYIY